MLARKSFFTLLDGLFEDSFFGSGFEVNYPKENDKNFNKIEEVQETENHTIKKEVWTSIDGHQKFEKIIKESKQKPKLENSKEDLKKLLDKAVEDQNFEKAIELRDKIAKLK